MNKKIIILLLLLPLSGATYAQDGVEDRRFQFGVRAGSTVNSLQAITTRDDGSVTESFDGVGWQVGGSAYFNILETAGITLKDQLGVETNLLFSDRMYYVGDNLNSLYYVEAPVMATYAMPLTKKLNLKFQMGPYFGVGLAGSNNAFTERFRRFNFGLTGGISLEFGHFFAGTFYNFGMFNIAKNAPSKYRQVLSSSNLVIGWNF
jgi:hypothetical protein